MPIAKQQNVGYVIGIVCAHTRKKVEEIKVKMTIHFKSGKSVDIDVIDKDAGLFIRSLDNEIRFTNLQNESRTILIDADQIEFIELRDRE